MMTMSSLAANVAATGSRQRPPESLKYYQSAVSMLRHRLADDVQRSSDAVIITLSNLCGFEVSLCHPSSDYVDNLLMGGVHIRPCQETTMLLICTPKVSDRL